MGMIISCENGEQVDTSVLSSEERHVIQKLLAWQSLADSMDFFRAKTAAALAAGWGESGPVNRTRALTLIIQSLERELRQRLVTDSQKG